MKVTKTQINNFIKTVKEDRQMGTPHARVDDNHKDVKNGWVMQIKSQKHDLVAYAFDIVGNMSALHADGYIRQHIGHDEIAVALGRF